MKYKNDYINKLEAALNLTETLQDALQNNKPYTRQELAQISGNISNTLKFVLERIELESE